MAFFLQILEGRTPGEAQPVLVTRDPEIVKLVAKLLAERLGADPAPTPGKAEPVVAETCRAAKCTSFGNRLSG